MIEIRPKPAGAHFLGQITIGGSDDAHIHMVFLISTHPLQLTTLQHTQQLGLHRQWQLTHLVKEQRTAIRQLEPAATPIDRPGKSAFDMPEQFAFDQHFRQRGAVEADQRLVCPRRVQMDGLGHQLLADTGFTHDQYRQRAVADQFNLLLHTLVNRALTNQLARRSPSGSALVDLGQLALIFKTPRQLVGALARHDRCRGEAGEGLQVIQIDAAEAGRVQRIQGNKPPGPPLNRQHAAQAIMHFQRAMTVDQPVIRVR